MRVTADSLRKLASVQANGMHRWDGMAVEREYADLLYTLVKMARPKLVVEAGYGKGYAACFIAQALRDSKHGLLISYEPDEEFFHQGVEGLQDTDWPIDLRYGTTLDLPPWECPSIVYIDSGPAYRLAEIEHWLGAGPGPTVIVHDANRDYPLQTLGHGLKLLDGDGLWIGTGR